MNHLYEVDHSPGTSHRISRGDAGPSVRAYRPSAHQRRRPVSEYLSSTSGNLNVSSRLSALQSTIPHPPTYDTAIENDQLPPARFDILPRQEEGRESLPSYSCTLNKECVFHRKMELDSPFDRCYDRTWSRVFVVLKGTMLSIHKVKTPGFFRRTSRTMEERPDRPAGTSAGKKIKSYTLQHAQVGIAADYAKRHFVIRIRAETDQFLLSCTMVETFLSWLESLGAAIDLSPPLDERSLPRYQTIPRRRRRNQTEARREQEEIINRYYPHLMNEESRAPPGDDDEILRVTQEPTPPATPAVNPRIGRRASAAANRLSLGNVPAIMSEVSAMLRQQGRDDRATLGGGHRIPEERSTASPAFHDIPPSPVSPTISVPTPKTPTPNTRRFSGLFPQIDVSLRRRSTVRDSIDVSELRMMNEEIMSTPSRSTETPYPGSVASSSTAPSSIRVPVNKWNPAHNWTEEHNIRYARRCMSVLCSDAPRQSDVIVRQGQRYKIRWDLGELTPLESEEPPEYDPSRGGAVTHPPLDGGMF